MPPPPGVAFSAGRLSGESLGHSSSAGWWTTPSPHTSSNFTESGVVWGASTYSKDGMSSDSFGCGMDNHPSGSFLSYLQNGHASFPAPWPPACNETMPTPSGSHGPAPFIKIDDVDDVRTAKRLTWIDDEDMRLVSAWLHNSNDPINGNCKKNESYWTDVTAVYNSTTPASRKREIKQLKDRFQKIKRWVGLFCGSWKKASSVYSSGQSDDQC